MFEEVRATVTLKDVALKAGVSITTVSRALNDKGRVAQSTRKKVVDAARSLGYIDAPTPNKTIGLLYSRRLPPLSTDAFYGPAIQSIEMCCRRAGYYLSVAGISAVDDHADETDALIDPYAGLIVLGADITPPVIQRLRWTGKPVVLVDNELEDGSADAVVIANRRGMYAITDFLIRGGHRDIAYVGGPRSHVSLRQRYDGFKERMNQAGINVAEALVQHVEDVPYAMITGQVGVERLVRSGRSFTAIVCDNDDVAVGATQQLLQMGRSVPDQVSVTGFDGRPMMIRPFITTVEVPRAQMGELAASRLLHLIDRQADGGDESPVTLTVSTSIVVQETTRALTVSDAATVTDG